MTNQDNLRKKYGIEKKWKKVAIFVGALNEVKGWSRILKLINSHHDIFWIIVSKHDEEFKQHNVKIYNKVNQVILCELYNCADFFIVGSPSETQCLAAIEACLCNIPIIMRDTGFVTNLSKSEKDQIGLIGENVEKIKQKDQTFIPREIVTKYYSIDDMCEKWIKFLDKIC